MDAVGLKKIALILFCSKGVEEEERGRKYTFASTVVYANHDTPITV